MRCFTASAFVHHHNTSPRKTQTVPSGCRAQQRRSAQRIIYALVHSPRFESTNDRHCAVGAVQNNAPSSDLRNVLRFGSWRFRDQPMGKGAKRKASAALDGKSVCHGNGTITR
jgi:hypothetical protein